MTGRPPAGAARHLAVLALAAAGYLMIRVALAPFAGPLRAWARTPAGKLALALAAAFVREVAVPAADARATADPRDLPAYLAGAPVRHAGIGRA